jgi:hypothetical protein
VTSELVPLARNTSSREITWFPVPGPSGGVEIKRARLLMTFHSLIKNWDGSNRLQNAPSQSPAVQILFLPSICGIFCCRTSDGFVGFIVPLPAGVGSARSISWPVPSLSPQNRDLHPSGFQYRSIASSRCHSLTKSPRF